MTTDERAALVRISDDADKAWRALEQLEADRESGIGTALLAAYLDQVRRGLAELLREEQR